MKTLHISTKVILILSIIVVVIGITSGIFTSQHIVVIPKENERVLNLLQHLPPNTHPLPATPVPLSIYSLKLNSTGYLTIKYNIHNPPNNVHFPYPYIYSNIPQDNLTTITSGLDVTANPSIFPPQADGNVTFTITSHKSKGLFWLQVDSGANRAIAVGLDIDEINHIVVDPPIDGANSTSFNISTIHDVEIKNMITITRGY